MDVLFTAKFTAGEDTVMFRWEVFLKNQPDKQEPHVFSGGISLHFSIRVEFFHLEQDVPADYGSDYAADYAAQ
jgi:hypothetical protein